MAISHTKYQVKPTCEFSAVNMVFRNLNRHVDNWKGGQMGGKENILFNFPDTWNKNYSKKLKPEKSTKA